MFRHYVVAALAGFRRTPVATVVNVAALALGLASFLAANAIADFWASADRQFRNAERTVVVTTRHRAREGGYDSGTAPLSSDVFASYLEADFPQLEATARAGIFGQETAMSGDGRVARLRTMTADADFLTIFDLPFLSGDTRDALRAPGSVVLTKAAAETLFGTSRALGRPVIIDGLTGTVTGVIDAISEPSHLARSGPLRFEALVSMDLYASTYRRRVGEDFSERPEIWVAHAVTTYVLLPADGSFSKDELSQQLPAFLERHVPAAELREFELTADLIPVTDLLAIGISARVLPRQVSISLSTALLMLGGLVLAVACVNFTQLTTARAAERVREIGLRKVVGAGASHIALQCFVEIGLLVGMALVIAVLLVAALLPIFDASLAFVRNDLGRLLRWPTLISLTTVVILAAGSYPVLFLSRAPPMVALRLGQLRAGSRGMSVWLLGTQFAVVTFLFTSVAIVHLQNGELRRAGLGLAADPLLVIQNDSRVTGVSQTTLRAELLRLPEVLGETLMMTPPWTDPPFMMPFRAVPDDTGPVQTALLYFVGEDFFDTLDVELLAGRDFDPSRRQDIGSVGRPPTGIQSVVISHELAEELGASSPKALVGRTLYIGTRPNEVIGVVENSVLSLSASRGPRPRAYMFNPTELSYHVVKLPADEILEALAAIDSLWQRLAPDVAISRRFADDYFESSYANFARIDRALTALAVTAAAIAMVGLIAVALSVVRRRRPEIGVRKLLGGSSLQMIRMLVAELSVPVIVANIVAWPLAYIAARLYLDFFIVPIELTPTPFVGSLIATVAIAGVAVGQLVWRAARVQPAAVLMRE